MRSPSNNNVQTQFAHTIMKTSLVITLALLAFILSTFTAPRVAAHCDTLDGPVVGTAKLALAKGNVTPVLKWVNKDGVWKFSNPRSTRTTASRPAVHTLRLTLSLLITSRLSTPLPHASLRNITISVSGTAGGNRPRTAAGS